MQLESGTINSMHKHIIMMWIINSIIYTVILAHHSSVVCTVALVGIWSIIQTLRERSLRSIAFEIVIAFAWQFIFIP